MNCSKCNFYKSIRSTSCLPLSQRFGECRLHPPRVVATSNPREHQTLAAFPIVSEHDWCGEFVPWPAPLHERATNRVTDELDPVVYDDATDANVGGNADECQGGSREVPKWQDPEGSAATLGTPAKN